MATLSSALPSKIVPLLLGPRFRLPRHGRLPLPAMIRAQPIGWATVAPLNKARALISGLRGADMARGFGMVTGRSHTPRLSMRCQSSSATWICTLPMMLRFTPEA